MKITIVMDDYSGMMREVVAHHGFSALVELENTKKYSLIPVRMVKIF